MPYRVQREGATVTFYASYDNSVFPDWVSFN